MWEARSAIIGRHPPRRWGRPPRRRSAAGDQRPHGGSRQRGHDAEDERSEHQVAAERDGGTEEQARDDVEREVRPDVHAGEGHQHRGGGSEPAETTVAEQDAGRDGAGHHGVVAGEREVVAVVDQDERVREHRERSCLVHESAQGLVETECQQRGHRRPQCRRHHRRSRVLASLPPGQHQDAREQQDAVLREQPQGLVEHRGVAGELVDLQERVALQVLPHHCSPAPQADAGGGAASGRETPSCSQTACPHTSPTAR